MHRLRRVPPSPPVSQDGYMGLYGNVAIHKAYCPSCNGFFFVIGGALACCGRLVAASPARYKRESPAEQRRRLTPAAARRARLELQQWRCFYCDRRFGSVVFKWTKPLRLMV